MTLQPEQQLDSQAMGVVVVSDDLDRLIAGGQRLGLAVIEVQQPCPVEVVAGQYEAARLLELDRAVQVVQGLGPLGRGRGLAREFHVGTAAVERRPGWPKGDRPAELLNGLVRFALLLVDLGQRGIRFQAATVEPDGRLRVRRRRFQSPGAEGQALHG